ncbi:MAG: TerC family protein [Singulisphaera sp.]|nr:TerC family protein [Singulisphaera sp.]
MWSIVAADLFLILGTIASLVLLEGLLSADNALVLAVMVRHLPREEQRRALRYGIWGAFGFRLIAVVLSAGLLKFWGFQVVGGLYLLFLAIRHFLTAAEDPGRPRPPCFGTGFWPTVVAVELADIAFSIDSIVAAIAMAPRSLGYYWQLAVVYLGGILGIITMRFVAGYFLLLLERFHGLADGAYVLIAWIGLKLIGNGLHHFRESLPTEMPEWLFWTGMALIVIVSMLSRPHPGTKPSEDLLHVGQVEDRSDA